MDIFDKQCAILFEQIGKHKKMVLSTSLKDYVTSRMMSVVITDNLFYFQTDKNFRKYGQLQGNNKASLCIENIQVEGICKEIGHPLDNPVFNDLFKEGFRGSYDRYSALIDERLFELKPAYIQRWIYVDNEPFIEIYDFGKKLYELKPYTAE